MASKIVSVDAGSPAARAGLRAGETLLQIDGTAIRDVLDYKFYSYDARLTLRVLEAEFALFWILVVAGCVLYETDVLPQGSMVGDAQAEYILQTVGILLTVCLIPLSLRMFSLSLTRYVRQLSLPEALVSYRRWCEIRLAMLLAPALFNLTVYYTTLDVTSLLCMGMLLVASLFCVPGRGRLMRELDLQKDEPEK